MMIGSQCVLWKRWRGLGGRQRGENWLFGNVKEPVRLTAVEVYLLWSLNAVWFLPVVDKSGQLWGEKWWNPVISPRGELYIESFWKNSLWQDSDKVENIGEISPDCSSGWQTSSCFCWDLREAVNKNMRHVTCVTSQFREVWIKSYNF